MQTYKLFSDDNEKYISRDEVLQIIDEKIKECLGMKYTRTKIMETGAFSEFLPKGSKLYMSPELPKVRFKKNGVKYAVTDLHLLNQEAIRVFEIILDTVIDMPNCREVKYKITEEYQYEQCRRSEKRCSCCGQRFDWRAAEREDKNNG